ncbi:MAG: HNH endonuclease [Saprospiraceae bacterium]|nr:HNH endonuclease [Saprospiraceae bacterium]
MPNTPKKTRIPINIEIATNVKYLSDMTCCVCNDKSKQIQIHHLDENPSNNHIDNLALLCFDCHDKTMIRGGFGRRYDKALITKYRDEWLIRVKDRREKADEYSIKSLVGNIVYNNREDEEYYYNEINDNPEVLVSYLKKILIIKKANLIIAQTHGVSTQGLKKQAYQMIDFYEEILIELTSFYPKNQFSQGSHKVYINELISSLYRWYYSVTMFNGRETLGTMFPLMVVGKVENDLEEKVIDMVRGLFFRYDEFLYDKLNEDNWILDWKERID